MDLPRAMTLKDVANHLGISWDVIKEIHSVYLQCHYNPPSLKDVESIDNDEFAIKRVYL